LSDRTSKRPWLIAGLVAGALLAVIALRGHLYSVQGPVDVPYPAGKVTEVRVLDAVSVKVDGEPRPGPSVLGAIALFMLATASFMTFAALRTASAERRVTRFWLIAAAGLAVAASDELFAVHESIGHNLPVLADLPGVKRPDDLLMLLYLPGALVFAWWFRDVLREHRPTLVCMSAAIACFGLSAACDLASVHAEEWFELLAGLWVATGLAALMRRHLARNLRITIRAGDAQEGFASSESPNSHSVGSVSSRPMPADARMAAAAPAGTGGR
jgi:hypothetical protein